LQTGSGSPAGIEMYEGDLLSEDFVGALIHCEPGHNEVRAFKPRAAGSGLEVEQTTLVDGKADRWFRPVDVAAAPDGSLMVADWYDPGVGGHHQADVDRGRIYRVAPRGMPYRSEPLDDDAPEAWAARLASANHDVRRRAWQRLHAQGEAALPALRQLFKSPTPERRAQALWLLTLCPTAAEEALQAASEDIDDRVQIAALRASRSLGEATLKRQLRQAVNDPSQQVRREAAVALRWLDVDDPLRPWLWGQLAARYEAGDRWMLEALGLAADDDWEACLEAWLGMAGRDAWERPAGRDLVWRARGATALDYQAKLLLDDATAEAELPRLLRALDFSRTDDKSRRLVDLAQAAADLAPPRRGLIMSETLFRLEGEPTAASRALVEQLLAAGEAGQRALEFVMKFRIDDRYSDLLQEALRTGTSMDDAVRTVQFLLREQQWDLLRAPLQQEEGPRGRMIELLAASGGRPAVEFLLPTALDLQQEPTLRQEAIRAIAANREGAERLVDLAEQRILDQEGRTALALALRLTPFQDLAERTAADAPELPDAENETFAIEHWMRMAGNADHGRQLFFGKATCSTCHRVGDQGQDVGPALTEIGSKLSRTGLFESVLYPSAAISHNYETYLALTADGTAVSGVLRGETAEGVTLRNDKGVDLELPRSELASLEKQTISLMPAGLHRLLAPHELADLIAYLATLRKGE
jgi:putative heme-binding domain-containing protein